MTDSRVLIITDRNELDEQIEKVFKGVDEAIYRTRSGVDLVRVLNASEEWLVCSLIHKFGAGKELSGEEIDAYVEEIKKSLPRGLPPRAIATCSWTNATAPNQVSCMRP